jgi:hypothetical protein
MSGFGLNELALICGLFCVLVLLPLGFTLGLNRRRRRR